jgi:predicted ATPase
MRGEIGLAYPIVNQFLRAAEGQTDSRPLLIASRAFGSNSLFLGRPEPACAYLERALVMYDPGDRRVLVSEYAMEPRVVMLCHLGIARLLLGYPDQALTHVRDAEAEAEAASHAITLAHALGFSCIFHQMLRDERAALGDTAQKLAEAAEKEGFGYWSRIGPILRGSTFAEQGRPADGVAEIREGLSRYQATGAGIFVPYFLALLAMASVQAGDRAMALVVWEQAHARMVATGERWYEAELRRLKGDLLSPDTAQAEIEACFLEAIEAAQAQGAKFFELRAATSLARLSLDQGERRKAHDLLARVYGWFTEGFETKDLKDAKALLDELA